MPEPARLAGILLTASRGCTARSRLP
ncbi:PEP-CTERM sorting domain-containing protein [Aeromonas salmonicida]